MDLSSALGDLLPLAVGVAMSPVPIIAVILILVSPRAVPSGLAFLAGWVVGIGALSSIASYLMRSVAAGEAGPRPWVGAISIVLGVALVGLALREGLRLRASTEQDEQAELPAWMGRVDGLSTTSAGALGSSLSALNPKNLALGMAAGAIVGRAAAEGVSAPMAISLFTIVASLSVALPVLARLFAGQRMAPALDRLRAWLTQNNKTIIFVLAVVIGMVLIGQGVGEF